MQLDSCMNLEHNVKYAYTFIHTLWLEFAALRAYFSCGSAAQGHVKYYKLLPPPPTSSSTIESSDYIRPYTLYKYILSIHIANKNANNLNN